MSEKGQWVALKDDENGYFRNEQVWYGHCEKDDLDIETFADWVQADVEYYMYTEDDVECPDSSEERFQQVVEYLEKVVENGSEVEHMYMWKVPSVRYGSGGWKAVLKSENKGGGTPVTRVRI